MTSSFFGLGSSGLAAVATAPSGTRLQATVNNSVHAQVAAATRSGQQGTAKAGKWSLAPSSLPVAATVALLRRAGCAHPGHRLLDRRGQPQRRHVDDCGPGGEHDRAQL